VPGLDLSAPNDPRAAACPRPDGFSLLAGTDLAAASEVTASVARFGPSYLNRVFTGGELAQCGAAEVAANGVPGLDGTAGHRLAARFAAKEAVVKALGDEGPIDWRDIEVLASPAGKPYVRLHGRPAERAARRGVAQLELSLTHHGDLAHAVVVGWCAAPPGEPFLDDDTKGA
jgi:holo-[acyl-carrier protein] synthase